MIDTYHLTKRGMAAIHTVVARSGDNAEPVKLDSEHRWIIIPLFVLTTLAIVAVMFTVSYTFGHLITTLTMIESSSTDAYVPIAAVDSGSGSAEDGDHPPAYTEEQDENTPKHTAPRSRRADPDLHLVRTRPITASLRDTIRHLRARDGFRSLYRGLAVYLAWNGMRIVIVGLLSLVLPNAFGLVLAAIVAEVLLAQIHMTWIHVVISEPSTRSWYNRIPSRRTAWRKMAPAVAIWAVASQAVAVLPMLVCGSFGAVRRLKDPAYRPGSAAAYATVAQLTLAVLMTLALFVCLQIPATVTMVRVAASMLPDEDETVVPFDRTFAGRTTPEILGGQGKIGVVEAWRSFDWECRRRLLRTVVKVALVAAACWLAFTVVATLQIFLLGGETIGEMLKAIHGIPKKSH